jgi:hypothetical protein
MTTLCLHSLRDRLSLIISLLYHKLLI